MFFCLDILHSVSDLMDTIENVQEQLEPLLDATSRHNLDRRLQNMQHRYREIWVSVDGPDIDSKQQAYAELTYILREADDFAKIAREAGRYDLVTSIKNLQAQIRGSSLFRSGQKVKPAATIHVSHDLVRLFSPAAGEDVIVTDDREYTLRGSERIYQTPLGLSLAHLAPARPAYHPARITA